MILSKVEKPWTALFLGHLQGQELGAPWVKSATFHTIFGLLISVFFVFIYSNSLHYFRQENKAS